MTNIIIKTFCYQLCIATFIFTQETFFNQLEQKIRFQEEQAIADILCAADKVPQSECLNLSKEIESARKHIKQTLFGNSNQQYVWTPRQDTVTPSILKNHNDFTLGMLALYTAQYANMLNIKPGVIKTAYKHTKTNKYTFAYVTSDDIKNDLYKIYFHVDFFNEQNKVFPHAGHTILHEITHLIEGHALIKYLIIDTLKRYYNPRGLSHTLVKGIQNLLSIHEKIAHIAPLIWSSDISSITKIQQYAISIGILECPPIDNIHLTAQELTAYNVTIYAHHYNTSVKELIKMFNQMPTLKRAFLLKSSLYPTVALLGLGIGAYISNNIL